MIGVTWGWDGDTCAWYAELAGLSLVVEPAGPLVWSPITECYQPPRDDRDCTWHVQGDGRHGASTIAEAKSAAITAAVGLLVEALAHCHVPALPDGLSVSRWAIPRDDRTVLVRLPDRGELGNATSLTTDEVLAFARNLIAAALRAKEPDRG